MIATYAKQIISLGAKVTIISSDKDLMQLVRPNVALIDPKTMKTVGPKEVQAKFGVLPERVIDVQALAGDSTDNVPGIRGIGIKTAAQLISEYGSLDELLDRAGEIKQPKRREALVEQAETARISRTLVTLKDDVPAEELGLSSFERKPADPDVLRDFLAAQDFKALLRRLEPILGSSADILGAAKKEAWPASEPTYELVTAVTQLEEWVR